MAPKTKKRAIADSLESLSKLDFEKFCKNLVDRREEPRVNRSRVEDKNFLAVTDVLVSTFTEIRAVEVTVELLTDIGCSEEADRLVKETGGQASKPGPSDTARPSAEATGVNTMGAKHFVYQYQDQLIQRVKNIGPILDELLVKNVIQQECYDRIRALPTAQEKMRELYSGGGLQASTACKDVFYESLKKNEPYLIDDLKGK